MRIRLLLTLLPFAAGLGIAQDDFLKWDAKRANAILAAQRANGDVGRNLDLRVIRTDRSVNYKLRATWLTPEAIRAGARIEQLAKGLPDEEARQLVADAEKAGDTVILIELDPREGSGVIPRDWTATLSPRSQGNAASRTVRGVNSPKLQDLPALRGYGRRDYAYEAFWVVFPLRTPTGDPLFAADDREAELTVTVYEKAGKVRWTIPESIRNVR